MPEEINRLLTDQMADLLFTPSVDADENLTREGICKEKIHFVGNVMIDTLVRLLPQALRRWDDLSSSLQIQKEKYCLVTLHRPSNVDEPSILLSIMKALQELSRDITMVFPLHPRTRQELKKMESKTDGQHSEHRASGLSDFLALQRNAKLLLPIPAVFKRRPRIWGFPV
jgi:UDP-N-acetylglucosamine 2-epimerase (non-hydrolysing)